MYFIIIPSNESERQFVQFFFASGVSLKIEALNGFPSDRSLKMAFE